MQIPSGYLIFLLLESLAAGTPVIATRVGGLTDIITPETNCGLLVDYGDVPALAAALEQLRYNPALRAQYAENGKKAVARLFHIDKLMSDILTLYEN